MSTATNMPLPDRDDGNEPRPDLQVVRDPDAPAEPDTDTGTTVVPAETDAEITGPVPVVDTDGNPVAARAPLDVRLRDTALAFVAGIPAFGQVPASFRESLEYSQQGDWTTSDKSLKRVVHGLCTVLAYLGTYPLVEGLGKAREKPVGLVLVVLTLIALSATLTALL